MSNPQDKDYPPAAYSWYVVAMLSLAASFSYIDRSILNLLVQPIQADLHLTDFEFSLLQGIAFSIFYTLMGVPIARLADYKSRKNIIAIGIATWSLMTAVCGLARNYVHLFLARVGVGVGEASLFPTAFSMMADYFPRHKLGRANSLFTMGTSIGGGFAFLFGGYAIHALSDVVVLNPLAAEAFKPWQLVFLVVGLPGLLLALLIYMTVREPLRKGAARQAATARPISEIVDFVRANKKLFVTLFLAYPPMLMVFHGWIAWTPTFLIRTYGVPINEAAYWFGSAILTFGIAGILVGGSAIDFLFSRGYRDAAIRISIFAALGISITGALAPLMPTIGWAFVLLCPFIFLGNIVVLVPPIVIQMVSPNHMRAQVTAIFLLVVNLIAMGLGPTIIAAFTDFVFQDSNSIHHSLSLTTLLFCPVTALVLFYGLTPLRDSLRANT